MSGTVLVTGAAGFIGRALLRALAAEGRPVVAFDRRQDSYDGLPGVTAALGDIRDGAALRDLFLAHKPAVAVHLASVVSAGGDEKLDHAIDVDGTRNLLEAALAAGTRRVVVTSSGAAYGYHADNPVPLTEEAPLRGNDDFAYARHKRLVEEMLARYRAAHPGLEQVVFRPCTVLGPGVANQITALFERRFVLGLTGFTTPFVFVAETDVVAALARAAADGPPGLYNLAGDGTLSTAEIAARIGKPHRALPPWLLKAGFGIANALGLTRLGPQHVKFLQYRPVLANAKLKAVFGYVPRYSSAQAFDRYWQSRKAAA